MKLLSCGKVSLQKAALNKNVFENVDVSNHFRELVKNRRSIDGEGICCVARTGSLVIQRQMVGRSCVIFWLPDGDEITKIGRCSVVNTAEHDEEDFEYDSLLAVNEENVERE